VAITIESKKGVPVIKQRCALLIGVHDYVDPVFSNLHNTVNDVVQLGEVLKGFGYTVVVLHDDQKEERLKPTRENIWAELRRMIKHTGPGDLLLVHFGGHGVLDEKKTAYLVPANGRFAALEESAVNLETFKKELIAAHAQAKILLLDACHSGIKGRGALEMTPEFERLVLMEAEGMATLAACKKGQVAHEYEEKPHGAFTYFLLEGLQGKAKDDHNRFITFDGLKDYVTYAVKDWALKKGYQQHPNASTQLVGDPPLVEVKEIAENSKHFPSNPFTDVIAIHDPSRFIGREAEMRRLLNMLQGGSVALTGEPKIGKSSLLRHLERTWDGEVIGPIDCQFLVDREDFFQLIAKALVLDKHDWRTIRGALKSKAILFLLDELDVAPEKGLTHSDLALFRSLCGNNPDFKMVAVSRSPLKDVFPDPGKGSPAFNFLQPLTLGLLTDDEARLLLNHPWVPDAQDLSDVICDRLLEMAGRHPYKLQRAAFHCFESLEDPSYDWRSRYRQDMEHLL
jgi:hypothetical protein